MSKLKVVAFLASISIGSWAVAEAAVATTVGSITAISVCGAGTVSSSSCPGGTFDTQKVVLASGTNGTPLDGWNLPNAVDEHSSIFPPNTVGGNADYLFFVASGTDRQQSSYAPESPLEHTPNDIGVAVLSGRPDKSGQWRMTFAPGYGTPDTLGVTGQVFLAPTGQGRCPSTTDVTFDLNYAAPGTVFADPNGPPNSLLMLYEGANGCADSATRIMLGIATSSDNGQSWPTYAGTPSFTFAPPPYQNATEGPNIAETGAFGNQICIGIDCESAKPYAGYGRYPVLTPPAGPGTRESQPAAFVDDVNSASPIYVYSIQDYVPATPLPDGRTADLTIARAPLNGGSGRLEFEKWNGQPCSPSSPPCWVGPSHPKVANAAAEYPILKDSDGDFSTCSDPSQLRTSGSISYVAATQQYLLTFVCRTKVPLGEFGDVVGAAWFYSTSRDLSDPNQWSTPTEIIGTWNTFSSSDFYNGWYPSFMSLKQSPGRLTYRGYAFYLWGCEGGGCGGRNFTSRRVTIQTTDNIYSHPPDVTITGPATPLTSTGTATFTFQSNEAGSAFECALDSQTFTPCHSPATFGLATGTNDFSVKAINPFGIIGRAATTKVTYKPLPGQ